MVNIKLIFHAGYSAVHPIIYVTSSPDMPSSVLCKPRYQSEPTACPIYAASNIAKGCSTRKQTPGI